MRIKHLTTMNNFAKAQVANKRCAVASNPR